MEFRGLLAALELVVKQAYVVMDTGPLVCLPQLPPALTWCVGFGAVAVECLLPMSCCSLRVSTNTGNSSAATPPLTRLCLTRAYGYASVVGPIRGYESEASGRPREHPMLVPDRPPCVSILALVRDAVARLPNGEGKSSSTRESESQIHSQKRRMSDSSICCIR